MKFNLSQNLWKNSLLVDEFTLKKTLFFRYMAVHYPINYSNSANDVNALRKRIIKFLLPVCGLSLIFNVTKFFEATYKYGNEICFWSEHVDINLFTYLVNATMPMGFNETVMEDDFVVETVPVLEPTALRTNPTYSIYFNWFRFLVIGVVPFVLLVRFCSTLPNIVQLLLVYFSVFFII